VLTFADAAADVGAGVGEAALLPAGELPLVLLAEFLAFV
jgi:hypothetical protein